MSNYYADIQHTDHDSFIAMVLDFYEEDKEGFGSSFMTTKKIRNTIESANKYPNHLKIKIFKNQETILGYSILTSFWSNEYGGLVCILDELYIIPPYRNQGISSGFIGSLLNDTSYVKIQLEVFHDNPKAKKLYEKLGFEVIDRTFMNI